MPIGNTRRQPWVSYAPVSVNPYLSPISDGPPSPEAGRRGDDVLTPRVLAAMSQTRPWVTFLAVLGFVGAGFMVLGGLAMVFAAPAMMPEASFIGLIYLIPAVLYAVGANILYRYRTSISSLQAGFGVEALENALEHQKSFWRFTGLTTAVFLGLYALGIAAAVVLGVVLGM